MKFLSLLEQLSLAWFVVVVPLLFVNFGVVVDAVEYDCILSDPMVLYENNKNGDTLELQQVLNLEELTFTMKLNYTTYDTSGNAWIGIGINTGQNTKMTPGNVVIGRAYNDEDFTTSVMRYELINDKEDGSGVVPLDEYYQDFLQDATFEQPDYYTSILTFTQPIDDGDLFISPDSTWIFAVGLPDNAWEGKHDIHGSFRLTLTDDCVAIPDEPPTAPPTNSTEAEEEDEVSGSDVDGAEPSQDDPTLGSEDTTSGGASSGTGGYNTGSSVNQAQAGGGIVLLDTTKPNRQLWVAHGVVLAIAWGICAPLGIGASLLRNGLLKYVSPTNKGLWYQLHYYFNMLTILLTLVGFLLGVIATQMDEGEKHFSGDVHNKAGLFIFILCILQGAFGYFRPGLPTPPAATTASSSPPPPQPTTLPPTLTNEDEDGSTTHFEVSIENVDKANDDDKKSNNSSTAGSNASDTNNNSPSKKESSSLPGEKSTARLGWEYSHRLLGMVLLGLAWYNCHTGMELMIDNWDDTKDMTGVFWGVTGGITGMIFLLSYVIRI